MNSFGGQHTPREAQNILAGRYRMDYFQPDSSFPGGPPVMDNSESMERLSHNGSRLNHVAPVSGVKSYYLYLLTMRKLFPPTLCLNPLRAALPTLHFPLQKKIFRGR